MKAKFLFIIFQAMVVLLACSKKDSVDNNQPVITIPIVTTTTPTNVTTTSATCGGTITSDGGASITMRGVCWSVVIPTITDDKTMDGSGLGTFTSSMTNLYPQTVYSVRAYATNSAGTGYGNTLTVYTVNPPSIPTVTTTNASNIHSTYCHTGGEVTASGNAIVTDKGICWSTSPNPTIANNVVSYGSGGLGVFTSAIFNLSVHTTYYIRAYATNSVGTGYGNGISFTTKYVIGDGLGGGKIFYIDAANEHGLIAAISDQSGGVRWNNTSNPYGAVNAYNFYDGRTNTNNIVAAIGSGSNAAGICRFYTGGGFSDWFLPSANELSLLHDQRNVIGGFQAYWYWSSTASSTYNANAWALNFGSGTLSNIQDKTYLYLVRAIRTF